MLNPFNRLSTGQGFVRSVETDARTTMNQPSQLTIKCNYREAVDSPGTVVAVESISGRSQKSSSVDVGKNKRLNEWGVWGGDRLYNRENLGTCEKIEYQSYHRFGVHSSEIIGKLLNRKSLGQLSPESCANPSPPPPEIAKFYYNLQQGLSVAVACNRADCEML